MPTIDNFSIIFNGTSNVATFANSAPNTSVANTFTYEIWCSPTNTHQIDTQSTTGFSGNTGQRYLIHPANVSNSISNWYNSADIGVSIGTNGVSVYEYRSDSANGVFHMPALLVASNTVSSERFTQVVISVNDKQPKLYLNGNLFSTGLSSNSATLYAQTQKIGGGPYGHFSGGIGRVRLYDDIFSNSGVWNLYKASKNYFESYSISTAEETVVDLLINKEVLFTVTTEKVPNGANLTWQNIGTVTGTEFSDDANTGYTIVTSNTATISRIIKAESSNNKTIIIRLVDPITQNVVATSNTVTLQNLANYGNLWLWGSNGTGELGDNTITSRSSPVQTIAGGTNWKSVDFGGNQHVAGIKTDGTLWTWGENDFGQLGNNTNGNAMSSVNAKSSPVQTVAGGTNWKSVSCGWKHTAALKTDGTLWLWGRNDFGQLGTNNVTSYSSPVQTVAGGTNWKQIECSQSSAQGFTAGLKTDGSVWAWGFNSSGQLGTNNTTSRSSPVLTFGGGTGWQQVSCGESHMAAIASDGTLWSSGDNSFGQLGDNTVTGSSSAVQVVGANYYKQLSCGVSSTAAIGTDGTLWSWGRNDQGQLGDNTRTNRSSPVQTVSAGTNWKQVSTGGTTGGFSFTAAIKTDGTLWLWGRNFRGALGDNTNGNSKSSPVQTVTGGSNWKSVTTGSFSTAAIR